MFDFPDKNYSKGEGMGLQEGHYSWVECGVGVGCGAGALTFRFSIVVLSNNFAYMDFRNVTFLS